MTTLNDTGVWEIYIDDVEGELAMEQTESAANKIEVVEAEVFQRVLRERDILIVALEELADHERSLDRIVKPGDQLVPVHEFARMALIRIGLRGVRE